MCRIGVITLSHPLLFPSTMDSRYCILIIVNTVQEDTCSFSLVHVYKADTPIGFLQSIVFGRQSISFNYTCMSTVGKRAN